MSKSFNILFLPSWYPLKQGDLNGIFNQELALELSHSFHIFAIHVAFVDGLVRPEVLRKQYESGLVEHIICIPKRNFWLNQWRYFRLFFAELSYLESNFGEMNVVHVAVAWKMGILALLLKQFRNIKYIVTEHFTGYLPTDNSLSGYKKWLCLRVLRKANAVTVVGGGLKSALQQFQISSTIVPNFIHPQILTFNEVVELDPNVAFIHVSGFDNRQKQTEQIIFTFLKLRNKYPTITLTLVVPKIKFEQFVTKHTGMNVDGIILLEPGLGRLEYCRLISSKTCSISYSKFETFSMTTAESLCLGVPVIFTNSGGPEYYVTQEMGICVNHENTESLYLAMEGFINKNFFNRHSIQHSARKMFDSERILNSYRELYREVLS